MKSLFKNISPLPTVEELEKAIEDFEAIDWARIDIGSVDDFIPPSL
jgi:hypothetical protein